MKKLLSASICIVLMLGLPMGTASGQDASDAIAFVQSNADALGLTTDDVRGMIVTDDYRSRHNGVRHVYLQQASGGIGVRNALLNYIQVDSRQKIIASKFLPKLKERITGSIPGLGPVGAVEAAAGHLGLLITEPVQVLDSTPGSAQETTLSQGGIALENIAAKLVYEPLENGDVRLAWNIGIYTLDAAHFWEVRVDAGSGAVLGQNDLVVHDYWGGPMMPQGNVSPMLAPFAAGVTPQSEPAWAQSNPDSYFIFPFPNESPLHPVGVGTTQATVVDPHTTGGTSPVDGASPWGWHDTNGAAGPEFTDTRGNNVDAYQDQNNNGTPSRARPVSPTLDFNVPFNLTIDPLTGTNPDASIINLFYWNNIIHDVKYQYGFDEASGNFQINNYGRGGVGGDDVRAEGQDGGSNCNARMLTPSDGGRPRMQMYLCSNVTPRRDSDFDHAVIIHEFTHGTSNRLTGGPGTASCLNNTEQAGEGWSDWYALMMVQQPVHTAGQPRGMGTYLFGQPPDGPGIRARPYSTEFAVNNFTYDNIKTAAIPHGVGHVWATMAWDLNWALIGDLFTDAGGNACGGDNGNGGGSGFNPDMYVPGGDASAGGNNFAFQLLTDGMKAQACSPRLRRFPQWSHHCRRADDTGGRSRSADARWPQRQPHLADLRASWPRL